MKVPNVEAQKAASVEMIEWLQQVWQMMRDGRTLQADPFYPRNDKLTPEVVQDVLGWFETLFAREFKNYPSYHYRAQGVDASEYKLVPPHYDRLSASQRLAIVQGVDRIAQKYRAEETIAVQTGDGAPYPAANPTYSTYVEFAVGNEQSTQPDFYQAEMTVSPPSLEGPPYLEPDNSSEYYV